MYLGVRDPDCAACESRSASMIPNYQYHFGWHLVVHELPSDGMRRRVACHHVRKRALRLVSPRRPLEGRPVLLVGPVGRKHALLHGWHANALLGAEQVHRPARAAPLRREHDEKTRSDERMHRHEGHVVNLDSTMMRRCGPPTCCTTR